MSKIGIIGDSDSVLGFKAFGIETYPCDTTEQALSELKHMVKDDYGIIYIIESYYKKLDEEIAKYDEKLLPVIVPIPGIDGTFGVGLKSIKRSVEKAAGVDILFGDE